MKAWILLPLLAAFPLGASAEELYRWVDEKGQVTYSDMPPPPSVADVQQKRFGDKAGTQQLPYALQTATRDFPVILYTTDCGSGCEQAAKLLDVRGVPHAQKNAKDPKVAQELMKLMDGKVFAPVLVVGKSVVKGYEEGAWHSALDIAGYPKSNQLPRNLPTKRVAAAPEDSRSKEAPNARESANPSDASSPRNAAQPAAGANQ